MVTIPLGHANSPPRSARTHRCRFPHRPARRLPRRASGASGRRRAGPVRGPTSGRMMEAGPVREQLRRWVRTRRRARLCRRCLCGPPLACAASLGSTWTPDSSRPRTREGDQWPSEAYVRHRAALRGSDITGQRQDRGQGRARNERAVNICRPEAPPRPPLPPTGGGSGIE